jgi:hypothetical protein
MTDVASGPVANGLDWGKRVRLGANVYTSLPRYSALPRITV